MIKALFGQFKRWYAIPYVLMCIFVTLQSASYHLSSNSFSLSWLGVSIAIGPLVVFMAVIYFLPWSGIANYIAVPFVAAFVGTVLAVIEMRPLPTFYSLFLGLGGVLVYIFWYSDLDRRDNPLLKIGSKLPDFTVKSIEDKELQSSAFLGRKTLFIFYRGNWCPVCQSQLQELAEQYQEIKRLGIVHHYGVPLGILGYGSDTVLPTALIVDESGSIVYADLTDNFRIIPRVQTLISALDGVW